MKKIIVFLLLGVMLAINSIVAAQEENTNNTIGSIDKATEIKIDEKPVVNRWILINVPARALRLYENDKCVAMYPVGVGTVNTKTPVGYYKVVEKIVNPTWIDPQDTSVVIPSGEDNPLGYRWIGIGGNYGIHGTNKPESVGKYVSNGCVRMVETDVEKVFDKVKIGTQVQIIYNRLVIDKTFDNRIAYYIYPDGYNMQTLTVDFVKQGLKGYGVADFVSDESIIQAIKLENGQPNYVAAPVNIMFNGNKLKFKAVNYQNLIYVPVLDLAKVLNTNIVIKNNQVISSKGSATINLYNQVAYMRLTDIINVFDYACELNKDFTVANLEPITALNTQVKSEVKDENNIKKEVSKQDKVNNVVEKEITNTKVKVSDKQSSINNVDTKDKNIKNKNSQEIKIEQYRRIS